MNIMKCITKNSAYSILRIGYTAKYIDKAVKTEFLGLQIDKHLNWKNLSQQIIHKLSGECNALAWCSISVTLPL